MTDSGGEEIVAYAYEMRHVTVDTFDCSRNRMYIERRDAWDESIRLLRGYVTDVKPTVNANERVVDDVKRVFIVGKRCGMGLLTVSFTL